MSKKKLKFGDVVAAAKQVEQNVPFWALVLAGEAAGEGEQGLRAVASVMYNRAKKGRKYWGGSDLDSVARQKGQFSAATLPKPRLMKRYLEVKPIVDRIVQEIKTGRFKSNLPDYVTYYWRYDIDQKMRKQPWTKNLGTYKRIGNHIFYYERRDKK